MTTCTPAKSSTPTTRDGLVYQTGFGNTLESECLPGALPQGRNNPRQVPYNLYAEQLSGTAFTAPRAENQRTWLYRIQPSVANGTENKETQLTLFWGGVDPALAVTTPRPLRWKPKPFSKDQHCDFVSGMSLMATCGSPLEKSGLSIYMYAFNQCMSDTKRHLYNADGDFLIVTQQASLRILTEMGQLVVHPKDICVIPRGIVFSVDIYSANQKTQEETFARGYVLEIFKGHFQLPQLGPIGSNGLANARDFYYPTAWCASKEDSTHNAGTLVRKFGGQLFSKTLCHSPYNVVAWHGNYLPFIYDLTRFCAINSVTYDHLDPSIYTVLTCAGSEPGTALADFVIFPPRIMATDSNTLRPPWFHRNTMTEFMGLISGQYDAKEGFQAGGASLHSCMTPHGPDTVSYQKAVADECLEPTKFEGGLAFMFETSLILKVSPEALSDRYLDLDYEQCWQDLSGNLFTGWDQLK
jgi:homogentisate 1,2-dioxygenase